MWNKTDPLLSESGMALDDLDDPGYDKPLAVPKTSSEATKSPLTASDDTGDISVQDQLKAIERRVRSQKRRLVGSVLDIGQALEEAQTLLAEDGTGAFKRWVQNSCGFSPKTAYRYLGVWRVFGDRDKKTLSHFDLSALTHLSVESAPPKALAEALEIAQKGDKVTNRKAQQLIRKYTVDSHKRPNKRPEPLILEVPGGVVVIRLASHDADPGTMLSAAMKEWRGTARTEAA